MIKTKTMTTPRKRISIPKNSTMVINTQKNFTADVTKEIELKAYELFEQRGCVHGYHEQDWLEAERLVKRQK